MRQTSLQLMLLLVSCASSNHQIPERVPASSESEFLTREIVGLLRDNVVRVEKSFYAFHYLSLGSDLQVAPENIESLSGDIAIKHLNSWSKWFFNMSQKLQGQDAQGLYAALDPLSSRNWGKEDWVLMRMEIPSGFRILDLNNVLAKQQSVDAKISRLSLELESMCRNGSSSRSWMKTGSLKCREFFTRILALLEADAILYGPWKSNQFPDLCKSVENSALLILKTEKIQKSKVETFTYLGVGKNQSLESSIIEKLRQINVTPTMKYDEGMKYHANLWQPGVVKPATDVEAASYLKEHVLGCRK